MAQLFQAITIARAVYLHLKPICPAMSVIPCACSGKHKYFQGIV